MRLTEVHLEGFGRLVNQRFRFTPGLNLVFGPNEAGKSSLQQALIALLYGFPPEALGSDQELSLLRALKPWDEKTFYSGSLNYVLDSGQGFRVLRRFLPRPDTLLQTHPEGVDVSGRFRAGPDERVTFAGEQLGVSREVFESVCVIRQGGLAAPAARAVIDALKQQLASASADLATTEALQRLDAALAENAPTGASGPLATAQATQARLEQERAQLARARSEAVGRAATLEEVAGRLQRLELQREQLTLLQKKAARGKEVVHTAATDETTAELRRCEAEVARWQAWAEFPAQTRDEVLRLATQRTHLQHEVVAAERRARQADKALQSLATEEAALQRRLAELSGAEKLPAEDTTPIRTLADEWKEATESATAANKRLQTAQSSLQTLEQRLSEEAKPLEAVLPMGQAGLAAVQKRLHAARHRLAQARGALAEATARWSRLDMEEAQFQGLESSLRSSGGIPMADADDRQGHSSIGGMLRRLARSGQAASEAATYAEAQPLYAELLRCRVEVDAAQQSLRDTEATTLWQLGELLGGTLEDSAFALLSERLSVHLRAAGELDQKKISVTTLQADVERCRERVVKAERELRTALGRLGYDNADTAKALDAYLNPGERKSRPGGDGADRDRLRVRAEADLELVRLRSESHEQETQEWRDRQTGLAEVEGHLGELLSRAGVSVRAGNLEAGMEAYEEAFRNHERWQKAQADLQTAMRWHRALLGVHADAEEEAARLLELDSTLRALGAWQPGWSTVEPDRSQEEYAPLLEGVEQKLAAARNEQARLQATLDKQSGSLRHVAEIDEELAAAREEVHRLERFREALQMAHEELAAASQQYRQQFGPRLELLLYEGLHTLMPGKFSSAAIDPETLSVSVRVPGSGASLPAETLSGSARELVRLLLRLGIVRLMSQSMEKLPLLLDEPLVQCDRERQQQAFDYLAQQAENAQILFFTCDERLQARFREKWESSPLHQTLVME